VKVRARDQQVKPVRVNGFHWVKYKGQWTVGKWDGHKWSLPRIGIYKYQGDIDDVGEQLMRNAK
jgi:hypothetical protein